MEQQEYQILEGRWGKLIGSMGSFKKNCLFLKCIDGLMHDKFCLSSHVLGKTRSVFQL